MDASGGGGGFCGAGLKPRRSNDGPALGGGFRGAGLEPWWSKDGPALGGGWWVRPKRGLDIFGADGFGEEAERDCAGPLASGHGGGVSRTGDTASLPSVCSAAIAGD